MDLGGEPAHLGQLDQRVEWSCGLLIEEGDELGIEVIDLALQCLPATGQDTQRSLGRCHRIGRSAERSAAQTRTG